MCGGTEHWVFANADWHLRDAVLHDLVVGRWPLGYGPLQGQDTLLRAPLGYYLPAALIGKWGGLPRAHFAMAAWTALGATLFLLQVLSLTPARAGPALTAAAVVVLFSGFDIIGSLFDVPHFIAHWDVTRHLEWWAASYQYSSMTTQLFWVPNHALGGWLTMGLLCRAGGDGSRAAAAAARHGARSHVADARRGGRTLVAARGARHRAVRARTSARRHGARALGMVARSTRVGAGAPGGSRGGAPI